MSAKYGLPVDVRAKFNALSFISKSLNEGEIALAQIATLLLKFPHSPDVAKDGGAGRLVDLGWCPLEAGLLRGGDFEFEHPRLGGPPNAGRFTNKPKDASKPEAAKPKSGTSWPSKFANEAIRRAMMDYVMMLLETDPRVRTAIVIAEIAALGLDWLRAKFPDENFDPSQQRIQDQIYARLQPARTLGELQVQPDDHLLGYERHHVVEQTPSNLAKDSPPLEIITVKFGQDAIDDPSNLVWISRLTHEKITASYGEKDPDDPAGRIRRQVVSEKDFNTQREAGLAALRKNGALK